MVGRFVIVLSAAVLQIGLARAIYGTYLPSHPLGLLVAFTFVCFSFLGLGLVIAMLADSVPAVQALGQSDLPPDDHDRGRRRAAARAAGVGAEGRRVFPGQVRGRDAPGLHRPERPWAGRREVRAAAR